MPIKRTRVSSQYEHELQRAYYYIGERGLLINNDKRLTLKNKLETEIQTNLDIISRKWGTKVYLGNFGDKTGTINLNSSDQLIEALKAQGHKVPKNRQTDEETAQSLGIIRLFAATNDVALKSLLEISKLKTVLTRYVLAKLVNSTYYSSYVVTGTTTGRRGSKKHIFGFGNNAQNWPKYTAWGKEFRGAIEARPGKIFFSVDQKQAEDWIVVALSGNTSAYNDLLHGVDRHKKTAAFLFSIPESQVRKHPERFLGKKFRHANNYGMGKNTASDNLAKDSFAFTPKECEYLLGKMNEYDPSIKGVFHQYVQDCLSSDRMLRNPVGRERIFFGLRPRGENSKIFMEAYAYIPQSSVGDNTGLAVLYIESANEELSGGYTDGFGKFPIVHECHDSLILEIDDNEETVEQARKLFIEGFDRTFKFDNGFEVKIPLEAEFGYNLKDTVSTEVSKEKLGIPRQADDMQAESVIKAWQMAREQREILNAANATGALVGGIS